MTILGLYGISDVGKTALIQGITQSKTAKYQMESKKNITLKVGYASYSINNKIRYFLDAPGHKSFAIQTLRNIDLIDIGIYVVDCSKYNDPYALKLTLQHYLCFTSMLTVLKKPIVVLLNKADKLDKSDLIELYDKISSKNTQVFNFMPTCALSSSNMSHLRDKLEQVIIDNICIASKTYEELRPVFRCIKSFDINPVGVKLNLVKGGVLGGYAYEKLEPNSYLYYKDSLLNDWNKIKVQNVTSHTDKIYTIETSSDPFLYKNDKMKGVLFFSKPLDDTSENEHELSLRLSKVYDNLQKNDRVIVISEGQYFTCLVKKLIKSNQLVLKKEDKSSFVRIPGAFTVLLHMKNDSSGFKLVVSGVGFL